MIGNIGEIEQYSYTGGMQSFVVPKTGTYKLSVWGSKGGNTAEGASTGGYGGFACGTVLLSEGDILYICVGGFNGKSKNGVTQTTDTILNCYNGGGRGGNGGGFGGGATHIASKTGTLNTLSNEDLLVVAGGGGGGGHVYTETQDRYGGSGGGLVGGDAIGTYSTAKGATQTSGGTNTGSIVSNGKFGIGGRCDDIETAYVGGGGGGYYGGASGRTQGDCGSGGSGYVHTRMSNTEITNGVRNAINGYAEIELMSLTENNVFVGDKKVSAIYLGDETITIK